MVLGLKGVDSYDGAEKKYIYICYNKPERESCRGEDSQQQLKFFDLLTLSLCVTEASSTCEAFPTM